MSNTAARDIDGRALDRRVWLMARAMARVQYPTITDAELEQPAKRWNGTALADAECAVWQDFIPEAEAALAALTIAAPYPFCRSPEKCAGKGYCPNDPACNN